MPEIACERVPREDVSSYGIVETHQIRNGLGEIRRIVEKPKREDAPSNLAVVGRYILTPRIFKLLEGTQRGSGGEIQLTDAIAALLAKERVMAYRFAGRRFDCGSKLGYLEATVELGLKHPEVGPAFARYLEERRRA